MFQKLYTYASTVWYWTPRHGWRPAHAVACGPNRISLRIRRPNGLYALESHSPCRVAPRDVGHHRADIPLESPF